MALSDTAQEMITELQQVIGDTAEYVEKLQQKMDEISELKDNLDTYQGEAQKALEALEELSAEELTDSLDEAENLVG
jgi:uncharacterized coiled-coil DUF342 family protein